MRKSYLRALIEVILMLGVCTIGIIIGYYYNKPVVYTPPNVEIEETVSKTPDFYDKPPKEGLMEALLFYEVQYPEIVYNQAILETGDFTSRLCVNHNNLFGLYNSNKREYHKFEHWSESVVAYKEWVQYKYRPEEDYYNFLKRISYAEDSSYIEKLKRLSK